jgi:integrase
LDYKIHVFTDDYQLNTETYYDNICFVDHWFSVPFYGNMHVSIIRFVVMPVYKDARMLGFKSVQGFEPMDKREFTEKLDSFIHKYKDAGRALLILLYYTGCRPIEALGLTRESFRKDGVRLWVIFPAAKKGELGSLMLPISNSHIRELASFALQGWSPGYPIFFRLSGNAKRTVKKKHSKTGEIRIHEYREKTHKVRHLVKKFFGTTSYFFRHNRFSRASLKGASLKDIMELKRAKTEASCYPYLHFSKARKAKLVRYVSD